MTKNVEDMSAAELREHLAKKERAEKAAIESKKHEWRKNRDRLVLNVAHKAMEISKEMAAFKADAIVNANTLYDTMFDVFGRDAKKERMSYSLTTEADDYRVEVAKENRYKLDETSQAPLQVIKGILKDKFEARNKSMYKLIDDLLSKNSKGEYDDKLVLKLSKHEQSINDSRFSEAMDTLRASMKVVDIATYMRVYEKDAEGKWKLINLNFSSI